MNETNSAHNYSQYITFGMIIVMTSVGIVLLLNIQDSIDYDELHFQLNNQTRINELACTELFAIKQGVWVLPQEYQQIIKEDAENALEYKRCE